jgi:hypothetical protein
MSASAEDKRPGQMVCTSSGTSQAPAARNPRHQRFLEQLDLTELSDLPRDNARRADGAQSPAAGLAATPVPRAACVRPGPLKSVIRPYSPLRRLYDAINDQQVGFQARPVQSGIFRAAHAGFRPGLGLVSQSWASKRLANCCCPVALGWKRIPAGALAAPGNRHLTSRPGTGSHPRCLLTGTARAPFTDRREVPVKTPRPRQRAPARGIANHTDGVRTSHPASRKAALGPNSPARPLRRDKGKQ